MKSFLIEAKKEYKKSSVNGVRNQELYIEIIGNGL